MCTILSGLLSCLPCVPGSRQPLLLGYFAITLVGSHPREARHERVGKCSLRSDGKTDTVIRT